MEGRESTLATDSVIMILGRAKLPLFSKIMIVFRFLNSFSFEIIFDLRRPLLLFCGGHHSMGFYKSRLPLLTNAVLTGFGLQRRSFSSFWGISRTLHLFLTRCTSQRVLSQSRLIHHLEIPYWAPSPSRVTSLWAYSKLSRGRWVGRCQRWAGNHDPHYTTCRSCVSIRRSQVADTSLI